MPPTHPTGDFPGSMIAAPAPSPKITDGQSPANRDTNGVTRSVATMAVGLDKERASLRIVALPAHAAFTSKTGPRYPSRRATRATVGGTHCSPEFVEQIRC